MSQDSADTSFDYQLDERQRVMLEAMGIKLWLPDAQAAPATLEKNAQALDAENFKEKQPFAPTLPAQSAPELIALLATPPARIAPISTAPIGTAPASAAPASSTPSASSPLPEGIAQMNWAQLQTAVSQCRACSLCESRKNTVFGVGVPPVDAMQAPQADWLVVGEAPGENEDMQGEPFVGQSGKLLDNMLAAMKIGKDGAGLSRKEGVYIANVIKCRPPENRNPTAAEIATCEPYLARQIELLRPKMILAMGKFAISTVTGSNEPVGKLRGKVHKLHHPSYSAPVIVTYHPAYLLRNLPEKAKAWADLLLAMQTYRELPSTQSPAADQQA